MVGHGRRRSVLASVALVALVGGLLAACIPPPPPPASLACEPITVRLGLDPALGPTPGNAYASLFAAAQTPCVDSTGRGITFASIESFGLALQGASCSPDIGLTGEGSGTLRTSDGTIARVALSLGLDGPATGYLWVYISEGPLAHYSASARVHLRPVAGGGTCAEGVITAEAEVEALGFRPAG